MAIIMVAVVSSNARSMMILGLCLLFQVLRSPKPWFSNYLGHSHLGGISEHFFFPVEVPYPALGC